MTVEQFFEKYNGKGIDFDGAFGNQCVDLYRQYVKEVIQALQSAPVVGAKDIWVTYDKKAFKAIKNTPKGIPQLGDIVIWQAFSGNKYGHVAIFSKGTAKTFTSFDQNYPVGSLCHFQKHYYNNVIGWLHPKKFDTVNRTDDTIEQMSNWLVQMYAERGINIKKPEGEVRGRVQEIFDNAKKYNELEGRIKTLEKDLGGASAEAAEFEKRLQLSEKNREQVEKEVTDLRSSIVLRDTDIGKLTKEVVTLKETLDPNTKVLISKEEFEKLTKRRVLDRSSTSEIAGELISRFLRWFKDKKDIVGGGNK